MQSELGSFSKVNAVLTHHSTSDLSPFPRPILSSTPDSVQRPQTPSPPLPQPWYMPSVSNTNPSSQANNEPKGQKKVGRKPKFRDRKLQMLEEAVPDFLIARERKTTGADTKAVKLFYTQIVVEWIEEFGLKANVHSVETVTAQRQELCPKRPQHRETPTCVIAEV
jgi:hypothetical protein